MRFLDIGESTLKKITIQHICSAKRFLIRNFITLHFELKNIFALSLPSTRKISYKSQKVPLNFSHFINFYYLSLGLFNGKFLVILKIDSCSHQIILYVCSYEPFFLAFYPNIVLKSSFRSPKKLLFFIEEPYRTRPTIFTSLRFINVLTIYANSSIFFSVAND